jgi:hypothetical protein
VVNRSAGAVWSEIALWKAQNGPELNTEYTLIIAVAGYSGRMGAAALWDIWHRPVDEINGDWRLWTLASFVNFVGPIAYFLFGRKGCCQKDEPRDTRCAGLRSGFWRAHRLKLLADRVFAAAVGHFVCRPDRQSEQAFCPSSERVLRIRVGWMLELNNYCLA